MCRPNRGVPPSPLMTRPDDPPKSRKTPQTPPFTAAIPREPQDQAMQKKAPDADKGGRGVP
ncbi:hypothetical protein, partial [Methanoregula sp.]|uniref:hypothetical protein n=1 Tax=Methanoregula sp. TaxID=2052170 RepID=UPI003C72FB0F